MPSVCADGLESRQDHGDGFLEEVALSLIPKQGLVERVGAEAQVTMPWGGAVSPLGASLLGRSFPPSGFMPIFIAPLWRLLVRKRSYYVPLLDFGDIWEAWVLSESMGGGGLPSWLPSLSFCCRLVPPLLEPCSPSPLPLLPSNFPLPLFAPWPWLPLSLLLPPLLSPLSRFFSFLSGEQRQSVLPRGMSSKKLQF